MKVLMATYNTDRSHTQWLHFLDMTSETSSPDIRQLMYLWLTVNPPHPHISYNETPLGHCDMTRNEGLQLSPESKRTLREWYSRSSPSTGCLSYWRSRWLGGPCSSSPPWRSPSLARTAILAFSVCYIPVATVPRSSSVGPHQTWWVLTRGAFQTSEGLCPWLVWFNGMLTQWSVWRQNGLS